MMKISNNLDTQQVNISGKRYFIYIYFRYVMIELIVYHLNKL